MVKKAISLFLILLLFTVSSFEVVFAADKAIADKSQISSETYIIGGNKYTVKIVEDNNSIRKVFVEEEDKLTVVTYNKDTGEFDIKEIGKNTGEKKEYKLESKINNISKQGIKGTIDNSIITPLYLILLDEKDLWWGYGLNVIQYTGQNDYVWNLYTPKSGKSVYENSHNTNDLYNAKQDANHCDYYFNRVQF